MKNEWTRKCSHCRQNGHNSRTCSKGCPAGFKLFGVRIDIKSHGYSDGIRKCKSLNNLQVCNPENAVAAEASGYLSDGLIHQSSKSHERKKGKPWSEDEHRSFLLGLEKLGKGDWKGIATNFVPSRNSSQVASHAQKYFIRMAAAERKRRRPSVFDIPLADANQPARVVSGSQSNKTAAESSQLSSMPTLLAASERPPLSPMKRRGVPDFRSRVAYMPRVSSFTQGFPGKTVTPTVPWVPVVKFSSQATAYPPKIHGTFTSCATFVPQPSAAALHQTLGRPGSSQGGSAAGPATNKEGLNLNIRGLAL